MSISTEPRLSPEHKALEIAEQRLRRALRAGSIAVWEWDLSTGHVVWSENAEQFLGLRSGHTSEFDDKVHPQDQERHQAAFQVTIDTGEPYDIEFRFVKPDGTVIWVHDKAELQWHQSQRIIIGITADVTARKRAEAEAREKAALLEVTLEHMDQGLVLIGANERVLIHNRRAIELLGLPPEMLSAKPHFEEVRQHQLRSGEYSHMGGEVLNLAMQPQFNAGPRVYERERPNGTVLEVNTAPLPEGGAVRTYTDITSHKKAEIELRQSEERYRALVTASALIVWRASPDGAIIDSAGWRDHTGQSLTASRQHGWLDAIHPDDRERVVAKWQEVLASGRAGENPYRARSTVGEYRWMLSRGAPVRNPDGTIREWVGTVTDIHEQTVTQQELARSEERFRDFAEIGSDWFWETDADHRYTSVAGKPTAVPFVGKTRWEGMGADPESPEWREHIRSVCAHQPFRHFEYAAVLKGVTYHLSSSGKPLFGLDGGFVGHRGVTTDITARKEAELLAEEKAALLAATLGNMDQGLLMFDASETIQVYNERAAELLGLPKQLLEQRPTFRQLVAHQVETEEFARGDEALRRYADRVNHTRHVYERERPDGTMLEIRTVPLARGGAVRTYTDITARRQAEVELKDSEARYRLLADNATDVIFRTGLDGRRLYLSPAAYEVYGYYPEEMTNTDFTHLVHSDDAPKLRIDLEATIAGKSGHETTVFRVRHRAGHWNWVEVRRRLVRNERGEAVEVVGIIRDVTERKRLEEHLRQSQKMEAVGQLTGGIAHDFNNLLTVILGNAEMLTDNPTDAALAYGLSRQILNAAERGADLIQKLLAFGRRQSLKPERLKLSSAVDKMVPLLHRTMGEHIELKTDLHEGSLAALIDQTLLESAILNLVVNARDAMPRQGTLTIRTGERLAGPAEGALPMGQPVVYVTVSDTGAGIAPDVLPRVFEPFFTTKEVGKGSGLGLSMVYGFAEQTGGHVSIASQEGVGTSVTIVLPGVAPATSNARQDEKAPTLATPTARILVVEDQPEVLRFASSLLLSLGYEVEAVSTGPDALEVLTRDSRFDLLFSDVVLPKGMSGVELAQRAREVIPGLKVLLTSGYSEDVFEHHGRPDQGTLLLRKPYRRKDLAAMLTKVLASEQAFQGSGSEVVAFPGLHERRRA